jgi:hypothetical protein
VYLSFWLGSKFVGSVGLALILNNQVCWERWTREMILNHLRGRSCCTAVCPLGCCDHVISRLCLELQPLIWSPVGTDDTRDVMALLATLPRGAHLLPPLGLLIMLTIFFAEHRVSFSRRFVLWSFSGFLSRSCFLGLSFSGRKFGTAIDGGILGRPLWPLPLAISRQST